MDADRSKSALYSPMEVETNEETKEVEFLMIPGEERRDLKARKIPSHAWAHSPRPEVDAEGQTMRRELVLLRKGRPLERKLTFSVEMC